VSFSGSGEAYDRFMGRYSRRLAPGLADFAGIEAGMRVLDVGCGPGALTAELVSRVGADRVAAADPSESFAAATGESFPDADVRRAPAERLPWPDGAFDAVLAQLVVNFLADPVVGVREMARVARKGGVVAACTWDYGDGMRMLRAFWDAAAAIDPEPPDEAATMPIRTADDLRSVWADAGLAGVETGALEVEAAYDDFDDLWDSLLTGTGPAGAFTLSLDDEHRAGLREELRRRLGDPRGAFELPAKAWAVHGRHP
jgi:SAM-dependent methyltransferase